MVSMPLEEYKRKRRFEDTPEPPPKVEKKSKHRFVVQRHAATRHDALTDCRCEAEVLRRVMEQLK